MPWHEANKIEDESDRKFLLAKCVQIKEMIKQQQQAQMEQENESSNIITPV